MSTKKRVTKPKEERRKEILAAARELFAEKGYEATAVSDIVAQVEVAQGTFYLYFPSKRAVALALLEETVNEVVTALVETTPRFSRQQFDPMSGIEQLVRKVFDIFARDQDVIKLTHLQMAGEGYHQDEARPILQEVVETVKQVLAAGMSQGFFDRSLDPLISATLIVGLLENAAHYCFLWGVPAETESFVSTTVRFVQKILSPTGQTGTPVGEAAPF